MLSLAKYPQSLRWMNMDGGCWVDCLRDAESDAPGMDIYTASSAGDVEAVAEILSSVEGPELQAQLTLRRNVLGWNCLMYAAWQGDELLVRLLIRVLQAAGQDACVPSAGRLPRSGRTLLMVGARFGHLAVVRALCKEEFLESKDFRGQTALHHAVRGASEQIIAFLLEQGANVNARDNQGVTVWELGVRCRLAPHLQALLRGAGASPATPGNRQPILTLLELDGSTDVDQILHRLSLDKYLPILRHHEVDVPTLLTMTEEDLRQMGVSLLGPRRKLGLEIKRLRWLLGMDGALK